MFGQKRSIHDILRLALFVTQQIVHRDTHQPLSGFLGRPGDMRGDDAVFCREQGVVGGRRFAGKHVDGRTGNAPGIALQRVPQDVYDQRAELWLAPSLHYLPVRLRITQSNGDFVELQLKDSSPP